MLNAFAECHNFVGKPLAEDMICSARTHGLRQLLHELKADPEFSLHYVCRDDAPGDGFDGALRRFAVLYAPALYAPLSLFACDTTIG